MSNENRLLTLLSDYDWHWGDELATAVCWRFGATIYEVRHKGYSIETEHVGRKHRYRLRKP